ncbi:class I SAM-dependent methyltransferase [Streptomyces sp. NPDC048710]|uniref:class I SAM-dependent methyltransferase n=1 Tax=unclassified Streptomyces TaxID=2593676 RepID=UPI00371A556F
MPKPPLISASDELERSSVVANNSMNRERGLTGVNSYARELGFDPLTRLAGRPAPSWLDLCSGEGRALREAAGALSSDAVLTAVDLVGPLAPGAPTPPVLEEIVASVSSWAPSRTYDLITCVHGLHYIGDQLGLLCRAASWLTPDGLFITHFDPDSIRWADGSPAGRAALSALRAAGFRYSSRHHRLTLDGARDIRLPFRYVGADPSAGPNYTGQPAVGSHYSQEPTDRST